MWGGAGGEGVDGCPVLKLIAAFVQQDFQIEAFDNKEPDRSLAPSLPALTRRASQGFVEELLSPENRMGGGAAEHEHIREEEGHSLLLLVDANVAC